MDGYTLLEKSAPSFGFKDESTFESPSAPVLQDSPMSHMPQLLPVPGYRPSLAQAHPNDTRTHVLGTSPVPVVCPHCKLHTESRVTYGPGRKSHLVAACLCIFCLWCFICVPYAMTSLLKVNHFCRSCGGFIGTYND